MFFILNLHCNCDIFSLESEVASMRKKNTSIRLKEIMAERNLKQVDILKLAQPFSEKYNVKLNKSDLSQYISGKTEPGQDKLFVLGMALDVNESWLMGFDVPKERYNIQKSSYIEQQKNQKTAVNTPMILEGLKPLHLDGLAQKYFINFYNSLLNDNSERSYRLLKYMPKLNALTDEQLNIIYGMIDNMNPDPRNLTMDLAYDLENVSQKNNEK